MEYCNKKYNISNSTLKIFYWVSFYLTMNNLKHMIFRTDNDSITVKVHDPFPV